MKNKGLGDKFDKIFTSFEMGLEKPQNEIFSTVLRWANVGEPSSALHIGDHNVKDYQGALVRLGLLSYRHFSVRGSGGFSIGVIFGIIVSKALILGFLVSPPAGMHC